MNPHSRRSLTLALTAVGLVGAAVLSVPVSAQFGGRGGFGGVQADRELVDQFDRDGDGRLNAAERRAARQALESQGGGFGGGFGRGGRGGPGGALGPAEPSPTFDPTDATIYADTVPFYDLDSLRTLFFEFENDEFIDELVAFNDTDIEVPATLRIDGQTFHDVGVRTRGASSFGMVPKDRKLSLNVSLDFVDDDQAFQGYHTLNLLNANGDPTFLRAVLYLQAARQYLPAPQASFVRVVMNGENRGIYVNVQQFNRKFLEEWYDDSDGIRWHAPGSPNGRAGLEYLGDNPAAYQRLLEIKNQDQPESWQALVDLTRVLNETPLDQLESALAPIFDIDSALRFLALEVAFVNEDGYWTRASDYNLYREPSGVFYIIPHDVNEAFPSVGGGVGPGPGGPGFGGRGFGGRGGGRGGRGGGPTLDPLVGLTDATKPLRSRLLNVPALRERYLGYVRQIAEEWLDWNKLEPLVTKYQAMIEADVLADTRKLYTNEAFRADVDGLRGFVEARRTALLAAASGAE